MWLNSVLNIILIFNIFMFENYVRVQGQETLQVKQQQDIMQQPNQHLQQQPPQLQVYRNGPLIQRVTNDTQFQKLLNNYNEVRKQQQQLMLQQQQWQKQQQLWQQQQWHKRQPQKRQENWQQYQQDLLQQKQPLPQKQPVPNGISMIPSSYDDAMTDETNFQSRFKGIKITKITAKDPFMKVFDYDMEVGRRYANSERRRLLALSINEPMK